MTAPSGVRPRKRTLDWQLPAMPLGLDRMFDQAALVSRRLWRNRVLTAAVVLSLALGVGSVTAVFSLVDAVFLEPVPFPEPNRLLALFTVDPKNPGPLAFSFPNFEDVRLGTRAFEDLTAEIWLSVNLGETGKVVQTDAVLTTPNYFRTLGVPARLGRVYSPETLDEQDDDAQRSAVISHDLWKQRFGGDPGIIGRAVRINQLPFRVVAVLPEWFRGSHRLAGAEIWLPFRNYDALAERPTWINARRALLFFAFGRLAPGATMEQAQGELEAVSKRLAARYPQTNAGRSFKAVPFEESLIAPERRENLRKGAVVALFAAGLVLLIAIASASNLLLSRAGIRRREMALRLAVGATARDFFTQIFIESALLVALGSVLGLMLGLAGRDLLWGLRPSDVGANDIQLALNGRVLGFTLALAALSGLLANLLPVLQALRGDPGGELKQRSNAGLRQGWPWKPCLIARSLVIGQVALSVVALVGAYLFLSSHRSAQQIDPGFDTRHLALAEVNARRLNMPPARQMEFYESLIARIERLPGVRSAAIASDPVFGFHRLMRTVRMDARTDQPARFIPVTSVSPRYFETTDILILRGRGFAGVEPCSEQLVAVVNEAMAKAFWPNEAAIGKRFRLFGDPEDRAVVGVARNTSFADLGKTDTPLVYVPIHQDNTPIATLHVRAEQDPASLAARVAAEIRAAEPNHPAPEVKTISEVMDRALWSPRVSAGLLTVFGLMAMLLAAIGVYGVTAHLVAQRTEEIGVRMAMGACPIDVTQLVLKQTIALVGPGLAIGTAAAFLVVRLSQPSVLPKADSVIEPYFFASLLLAASALAASYLPARRAVRMMPAAALRREC